MTTAHAVSFQLQPILSTRNLSSLTLHNTTQLSDTAEQEDTERQQLHAASSASSSETSRLPTTIKLARAEKPAVT